MDQLPFVTAGLQARPRDRELLHRLSEAPLHLALHRAAAANRAAPSACGRRPSAAIATARAASAMWSRRSAGRRSAFPQVKEFFFDDDTFTDNLPRAEAIASELGKLGVTWSCNAKANVPRETLKVLRDNGLRLLLVGYEMRQPADPAQHQEGHADRGRAKRFTKDCHELGITIHGTFILGLPGETKETIEETIRFATEINPHTIQVSLAAPYPGTVPLQAGGGERLARRGAMPSWSTTTACRSRRCTIRICAHRDLPIGRDVLPALLLPRAEDRLDRRRDGAQPADDEAPPARRRRVLPVPARAPGAGALKRLIVTADDFGLCARGQRGGRGARTATAS